LANGIATLMTNLFGRGKGPFWQQASTNLVNFVILLHQTLAGYVTLFQVYDTSSSPTSSGLESRKASSAFARITGAWLWTSASTCSPTSRAGSDTTTRPEPGHGPNGQPISWRR
jgi:hypothetical protein